MKYWASLSHRYNQRFKLLFRYRMTIFPERDNISSYRLLDIGDRFPLRATLTDTADQAGAFGDPVTVFSGVK